MARSIYIAIPAYTGSIQVPTVGCLLDALGGLAQYGVSAAVRFSVADSIISRARNSFLADFLSKPEFSDIVFIDSDVAWHKDALLQLLSHDVGLVGGAYPKKIEPLEWPVTWKRGSAKDPATGLIEVDGIPGGFMRVSRAAAEQITEHHKALTYRDRSIDLPVCALFSNELVDGVWWGEDFTFCHRAQEAGIKVWLDPDIGFGHHGLKLYEGCVAHEAQRRIATAASVEGWKREQETPDGACGQPQEAESAGRIRHRAA